jgi:hypothetical protein
MPLIAKVRRKHQKHIGATRSKSPLPGGRLSKWKRRMDGTVVLRNKGDETCDS